jgi:DNA-binding transcriptional ArsR family regulator
MNDTTQEESRLSPTLWRTCRALANRKRLRMLQHLMKHPDATVSNLATSLAIPVPTASVYLRMLNARGVILATRQGPHVRYRMAPDPTVPESTVLVTGLQDELRRGGAGVETAFRMLTAFTHPRRIAIVVALAGSNSKGVAREDLRQRTGISRTSFAMHIDKLARRGVIVEDECVLRTATPATPLAKALLRIASSRCP